MPQSLLSIQEVAASLHVSTREVVRMAEQQILPATKVRGVWQFRAGEVWNWIEENLHVLPERRRKDRHPETKGELLISTTLLESAVAVDLAAKTKPSVIRELAGLAAVVDPYVDAGAMAEVLLEREKQGSTALQDGVAVPHPSRPLYSEGCILAAARTTGGIAFGEPGGGLTDLFFLVCCPNQTDHLLFLGRLCRLLIDKTLRDELRDAEDSREFIETIQKAEERLCEVG
ncbi:MAG: PTS sugar transporter subunit IIA [Phycisphaerales bacterium]|nr:PTS sugar transporter subunit IIA [Phycisphaerales bacterium]